MNKSNVAYLIILGFIIGDAQAIVRMNRRIRNIQNRARHDLNDAYMRAFKDGMTAASTDPDIVRSAYNLLFNSTPTEEHKN